MKITRIVDPNGDWEMTLRGIDLEENTEITIFINTGEVVNGIVQSASIKKMSDEIDNAINQAQFVRNETE